MTATGREIRRGGVADLDAVLALEQGIAEAPHWRREDYLAILQAGEVPRCLFIAAEGPEMLGYAVGAVWREGAGAKGRGELESVAVSAAERRSGLGRKLCGAVVAWCREKEADRVELEVRSTSAGAIALYRQLGFEVTGTRPRYYSEPVGDALLMRLDL